MLGAWGNCPEGVGVGEPAPSRFGDGKAGERSPPPVHATRGELAGQRRRTHPGGRGAGCMTNPATTQSQNQSPVWAQPSIQPIYDLLDHGVGVGGQSCGPRTPGSPQHRAATGCPGNEKSQGQPSVDGAPERRSLEPDSWFF